MKVRYLVKRTYNIEFDTDDLPEGLEPKEFASQAAAVSDLEKGGEVLVMVTKAELNRDRQSIRRYGRAKAALRRIAYWINTEVVDVQEAE